MKIENLKEGMIIKDYNDLCSTLNIPKKQGNSKISQLKELERYCKFHKDGYKFIIDNIYKDIRPKKNLKVENSLYSQYIEQLILNECSLIGAATLQDRPTLELPKMSLLLRLNMINSNYSEGRKNMNKFSQYLEVPIETINDFYLTTTKNNFNIIESVLNRLKGQSLIFWSNIIKIQKDNQIYTADEFEVQYILNTEREVLNEMNLRSKRDVFLKNKWIEFSTKVLRKIKDKYGITYYYSVYNIVCSDNFVEMILPNEKVEEVKRTLNQNCIKGSIRSAENRSQKALSSDKRGNIIYNRMSEDYVEDTKKITYLVIDTLCKTNLNDSLKEIVGNKKYTYKDYMLDKAIDSACEESDDVLIDFI